MLAGSCEVPLLSLQGSAGVIHVIEGTVLTAQSQSNVKEAREHHTEGKMPRERRRLGWRWGWDVAGREESSHPRGCEC